MEGLIKYPKIEPENNQFQFLSYQDLEKVEESREKWTLIDTDVMQDGKQLKRSESEVHPRVSGCNCMEILSSDGNQKKIEAFYYDTPFSEETGVWVPVSVPPVSENKHEEWDRGPCLNGGYFPDDGV
ncbi:hypothetical protein E1A91_D06G064100v1 [Gossypium mustelinum]|uniref:Uncharacterized protein n=1 Tax=Gossypium mustelinum TaxID=34275 RepID=A0A5D2UGB0_GOSMU|nr:hypothetical protein E1A91_D06G064100v1 [Gossypium mustelinum]